MTSKAPPHLYQIAEYAYITERSIDAVMKAAGFASDDYLISPARVRDISQNFLKDMYRLGEQQRGTISSTRFAGYWAFWIRKLKPILYAYNKKHVLYLSERSSSEITDINERVAIDVALRFLAFEGKGHGEKLHDFIRHECENGSCDGGECVTSYVSKLFAHHDAIFRDYLVSSMANRTFGPHNITIILEHIIFASCLSRSGGK